jgi:tRNA modification GTPase
VTDLSQPIDNTELNILQSIQGRLQGFADRCILVLNKLDLTGASSWGESQCRELSGGVPYVKLSALTHQGLESLKELLVDHVLLKKLTSGDVGVAVTNVRHKEALEKARIHLKLAAESLETGAKSEFVSLDLRIALDFLGEIIGVVTSEEILNNIFARFCIGK